MTSNKDRPKVAVLMSTYNGARYLKEQIESILNQQDVETTLLVRDDGSSDETVRIVEEGYPFVRVIHGANVGVGSSFMELIYEAGTEYDFYAFADQDDIWDEDKLSVAAEWIGDTTTPTLYCSNQLLVDGDNIEMRVRYDAPPDVSPMQILNDNLVSGCTMVWNRMLQELLADPSRRPTPELLRKRIHDVWVAMVASSVGVVIFDETPHIRYRQHEKNVVGVDRRSLKDEWRRKLGNSELRNGRSALAIELLRCMGDLIDDAALNDTLRICSNYLHDFKSKLAMLRDARFSEHSGEPRPMYMAKVLIGLV